MKRKVALSIDAALHNEAKLHAKTVHRTGFSGLVTKLIVADLALPRARQKRGGFIEEAEQEHTAALAKKPARRTNHASRK